MKSIKATLLLLLSLAFISLQLSAQSTNKYYNELGRFKAQFPATPSMDFSDVETGLLGQVTLFKFEYESTTDPKTLYRVVYVDYPFAIIDTISKAGTYKIFKDIVLSTYNESEFTISAPVIDTKSKFLNKEYQITRVKDGDFSKLKFFREGNRIFMVSVNIPAIHKTKPEVNQFINSFEIMESSPVEDSFELKAQELFDLIQISFPGSTTLLQEQTSTPYGDAHSYMRTYQGESVSSPNFMYIVVITKYNEDITKTKDFSLAKYYQERVSHMQQEQGATELFQKKIYSGKIQAHETKESAETLILKRQVFLDRDIGVSILVVTLPERYENQEMNAFFSSFKFNKR